MNTELPNTRPADTRRAARRRIAVVGLAGALLTAGLSFGVVATDSEVAGAASTVVARYMMDEGPRATVLLDSSGNGLNGRIGREVATGLVSGGTTYHNFDWIPPREQTYNPEHLDVVPDAPPLDFGNEDFAVIIRYRTRHSFGNVIQKGQNATSGGYFKIENNRRCRHLSGEERGRPAARGVERPRRSTTTSGTRSSAVAAAEGIAMFVDGVQTMTNSPVARDDLERLPADASAGSPSASSRTSSATTSPATSTWSRSAPGTSPTNRRSRLRPRPPLRLSRP